MPEQKYQDRDVLDKLGIKPGHTVALDHSDQAIDPDLLQRINERTGRGLASEDENVDIVLARINEISNAVALLQRWRPRLVPNGGIWLLTAKRNQPSYVDQRELIAAGQAADLVDNKICSVSATTSAMRFVIRKKSGVPKS
ncbi:MAG TPA: DUF3052 family protein [Ktedonobacteraceae bacterium]